MRPQFNRFRRDDGVKPPKERTARDYRATGEAVRMVEARIASHGDNELAYWLWSSGITTRCATDKAAVMLRIKDTRPKAVWQACCEVMR